MTRLRPWLIIGAALLLAGALVCLIIREYQARQAGTEVALRVQQMDPRSLLSGHYVQLTFIEEMPAGLACEQTMPGGSAAQPEREEAWIALRTNGDHHSFAGVGMTRQDAARHGSLQLRGTATCVGRSDTQVLLMIGLDRFHASQKEAETLEAVMRGPGDHAVHARVSVGKDGRARLAGLKVDGRETRLDWFGR